MIYIDTARKQIETHVLHLAESVSPDVRIKKQALTALALVSSVFALSVLSITFMGIVYPTVSFLSLPFLCFSWVVYQMGTCLKNYDDPFELQIMKAEARRMSFSELLHEHQGIDPILQYKIVSHSFLCSKFLSECEGKSLSTILHETPFSYVQKYGLMTKEQIRKFFIAELCNENSITNLCDRFGEFGLRELKRTEVISPSEYESLERIHAEEEKIDSLRSSRFLQLDTQFFARRNNLLSDLARREKEAKEELHKAHVQETSVPLSTIYGLQKQLKAIQKEKNRVEQDENLGKSMQKDYDRCTEEVSQEHRAKVLKLLEELQEVKDRF
jgi:hypothetical protein